MTETTTEQANSFERKTPKGMIFLGLGLLIVAVITAIVSLVGVKDFGKGYDVQAGKEYYLLADEDALTAKECALVDSEGKQLVDRIEAADLKFSQDDLEISDVSLPLTKNKGVYTSIKFTEDIEGAKYTCDQGSIYISKYSSGTLQALRWVTMLCGAAGVAILILAAFANQRKRGADDADDTADAEDTEDTED
ncbi:hypothetical protein [Corynebacterium sp. ACRPH]|uniref:hypothetical protein n=2 Tax=unclassified Corynebacterium TaxID=2624378 RepID=UPI001EF1993F|nr:hypothetical protein [Corynebacterium sp. ACRPH]MCG7456122.1 hypothetical protein [Corynebacterium sp. ACRPH]